MKTKRLFFKMTVVLMSMACLSGCSSSDSAEQAPTPPAPELPVYQSYLTADGLRADAINLTELAARTRLLQLLGIKMATKGYTDLTCSTTEYDEADMKRYYEVWQSLIDDKDKYEASLTRLSQSTALGTASPTRAWNIPFFSGFKLLGLWGKSASAGRVCIMAVAMKSGNINNHAWLKERFDNLPPFKRQGAKDYTEFWNNLSAGKYDNASNDLFDNMYSTGNDLEFWETAHDLGITPATNIKKTLGPMFEPAMNLVLNMTPATTVVAECGEVIKNTSDLAEAVQKGEGITGGVLKVSSAIGKAIINHYGHIEGMDSEVEQYLENAIKETGLGVIGETEDDIIKFIEENDLISKAMMGNVTEMAEEVLKETGNAATSFTDTDKESAADVAIATDANGDRISIGTASKDGKITNIVPGDKDVAVTAVDKTGDKHTTVTNVPTGKKKDLTGSTDEGKKAAEDITCELNPSSLTLDADGGTETVVVVTNAKYIIPKSNVSWIKVDQNAQTVFIYYDENLLPEVRKADISIGLSMDNETVLKTVTLSVTQEAAPIPDDLTLDFIDTDKLMIPSMWGLGVFLVNNKNYSTIHPEDIKVTEISEDTYKVEGTYANPMAYEYENEIPTELTLQKDKPYGLYYTITFTIHAILPTKLVEKNNFEVRDIYVKGYQKDIEKTYTLSKTSDRYREFETSVSLAALNWGEYDDGESKTVEVGTDHLDGQSYTVNYTNKEWFYYDDGQYQDDGNGNYVWVPKYVVRDTTENRDDGTFSMYLKWE